MKINADIVYETIMDVDVSSLTKEERDFLVDVDWVFSAEPVIRLDGSEFKKSDVDLITQISNYFNNIGGNVHRDNFGSVILNHRGAKDSIAHGIGRAKAAAFKAVPDVIRYGKIIDYQYNWKGRGYSTYVIAAPIVLGNVDYIVEVIVERNRNNGRNNFYLHEVETKEKARSVFKTATEHGTLRAEKDVFKTATERGTPNFSRLIIVKKLLKIIPPTNKIIDSNSKVNI